MYHKQGSTGRPDQPHHEYVCSSYRHYSRCVTGGRGHLGLRRSPQAPMNTGFLGRSKPRRGAG